MAQQITTSTRDHHERRGSSMIELLIVVAILIALAAIFGQMLTGSDGKEGAMDRAKRQVQQINLHEVFVGFNVSSNENNGLYPSTKTYRNMQSDTTHEVFRVLIEDTVLDGRQLVSPNEMDFDINVGNASNFTANNTSYALEDYDADNWLRYRKWNDTSGSSFALLSDRHWVDPAGTGYESINGDWWHVLMNDGSTQIARGDPVKPGTTDDYLFDRDSSYRDADALMVHD